MCVKPTWKKRKVSSEKWFAPITTQVKFQTDEEVPKTAAEMMAIMYDEPKTIEATPNENASNEVQDDAAKEEPPSNIGNEPTDNETPKPRGRGRPKKNTSWITTRKIHLLIKLINLYK